MAGYLAGQGLPPRPMTRKEAADYLRRSERTIDRMLKDGKIKATYLGRAVLIDTASVVATVHPQE